LILQEGAVADAFYLLIGGNVEVTQGRGKDLVRLAQLERGDFFGEMGLLQNAPRMASVTAGPAGANTLVLGRTSFLRIVSSSDMVASEIAGIVRRRLAENLLLETISRRGAAALDPLLPEFKIRRCAPGDFLVRQGDPAEHFFIVKTGRVRVLRQRPAEADVELAALGPGAFFGEVGLLTSAPRTAAVVAARDGTDPTTVWVTDRQGFLQLLRAAAHRHGELGEALLARLQSGSN
jgi:CRP-like cAMP-binding protein